MLLPRQLGNLEDFPCNKIIWLLSRIFSFSLFYLYLDSWRSQPRNVVHYNNFLIPRQFLLFFNTHPQLSNKKKLLTSLYPWESCHSETRIETDQRGCLLDNKSNLIIINQYEKYTEIKLKKFVFKFRKVHLIGSVVPKPNLIRFSFKRTQLEIILYVLFRHRTFINNFKIHSNSIRYLAIRRRTTTTVPTKIRSSIITIIT